MEGSKYYKPEMEEIHPGFECEVMDNTHFKHIKFPEGLKDIQELKQYQDDMMKMAHADVRVKYLDREDIESLGWKFESHTNINEGLYDYSISGMYLGEKCNFNLHVVGLKCWITVLFDGRTHLFEGVIKNKSELRKIMQMLGISK